MSAIRIVNANVRLFGIRLFTALVVLVLLAVGALTLRMALVTRGVMPSGVTASAAGSGSNAGVAAYWAAADEAYRKRAALLTSEQSERQKAYWAAADEAYRARSGLLTSDRAERQKAYWSAMNEALLHRAALLTSEVSEGQKAYWAAADEAYHTRYSSLTSDRAARQKAYWAAVNEFFQKRVGLSGQ